MYNYSNITTPTSVYTIDNNNKQEDCTNIPIDTTVLYIEYEGFKSTTGIGRVSKLEKIRILKCMQEIHFDEVENCTKLKEVQLVRSPATNKHLDKLKCRICAQPTLFDVDYIQPNVTALNLSSCGLTKVPTLHTFQKLVEIRFGVDFFSDNNNKLDVVDEANLPKNIQILDFSHCKLANQPDFHSFESLIELNLGNNTQIHQIDPNMLPKQLQKLHLQMYIWEKNDCGLAEQPDLHSLESLIEINLCGNEKISKIDPNRLPMQLMKLDASNCGLVQQPDLNLFKSLVDLCLGENGLIQQIEAIRLPANVQVLDLHETEISSLVQLQNCTKLKQLDVRCCGITDINQLQVLKLMPELQKFCCKDNDICYNENIKEALTLVLTPNIQEVEIYEYYNQNINIKREIKQMQTNIKIIKNPFSKKFDKMLDEQFYEDHIDEIVQLKHDIKAERCEAEQILLKLQQLIGMRQKIDQENCLIVRVLVGEQ